ncbi:MAG TPA: hypothetical protein DCR31_02160 [Ruminococcaceae bacterium]|nr:hypothetical protein [Oscillospiraceae bacterium]HAO68863.1 hypothetical protein [Oscillospiraceae bacterium]
MKKIIGIYLLLQAAMKSVCLFLSLRSDESLLPVIVLAFCVVLIVGAVYVAAMTFMQKARLRQISRFFVLEIALTVFNITFMFFQPVEMLPSDSWVTGNLFDILVAGVILVYLTRQKYYIRAKYITDSVGPDENEMVPAGQKTRPTV